MNINAITMCQQIGRFIGRQSDLVFVEPTSSIKGNVYATQLPKRALRNAPALSITDSTSGGQEPVSPTTRIPMVLHAEATSNKDAMELLAQVQLILFPDGRSTVLREAEWMPGTIGVPSEVGIHLVWRIIELNRTLYPQIILPRSPGGLAVAEMAIEALVVQNSITVTE